MLKQRSFQRATRKGVSTLSAICLSAFLVFGNAVSAFGNHAATRGGSKARASKSDARKASPASTPADESKTATADESKTSPNVKTTRKSVFKTEGEPFVVSTSEPQQTPTPRQNTPRPPGTEQTPTARPTPTDTRTPPGVERPTQQTPPGVQPAPTPQTPSSPTTAPSPSPTTTTPETTTTPLEEGQEPDFPAVQPRPVPPLPSLTRVGILTADTLSLTLNEAIRRALENNNDIEIARADVRIAEQSLIAFRGVFDPVFTYQPEINNSVQPVTNIFGGAGAGGTVTTTDYNNDVSINKQFGRGGGNFTYFFNNTRENTSRNNTTLNPIFSSIQGVQFTQPLWRNRAIDRNRQLIRIQRKRLEQSDADFRRRTIDVISQVQRAYWDLVFALRDEQNQIANINLARENFRRTEASVAAGASAPLERAEIQTELSNREAALLLANQQVTIAENNLKELLIKDPLNPDWSKAVVPVDQPTFDETPVSLESSLKEAHDNRPEMRRLKLESEVNDINLSFYKNQTKPRVDLTGTLQTSGLAGTPGLNPATGLTIPACTGAESATERCIPRNFVGGYGQTLQNLFNFKTRQVVVGVTIQIPFKNRTAEANYATAQIQREQLAAQTRSQEQSIEVEVRNAVQAVETARRRVLSARQARQSAEEQLAGERRLYQVGRSTTFLLFQRENALVNARNQELRAETDYNKALAELQRATSATLKSNNVIVDSPVAPEKFKD